MRLLALVGVLASIALHESVGVRAAYAAPTRGGIEWSFLHATLPSGTLEGFRVFDRATGDFRIPQPREVAGQRGRVVVLHMWAEWCGPCRDEMPLLRRLTQEASTAYGDHVEFVYVNVSDNASAARMFVAENGAVLPKTPQYLELGGRLARWLHGLQASEQNTLPVTLVLDSRRVVRFAVVGSVSPHRQALTTTLARLNALERY